MEPASSRSLRSIVTRPSRCIARSTMGIATRFCAEILSQGREFPPAASSLPRYTYRAFRSCTHTLNYSQKGTLKATSAQGLSFHRHCPNRCCLRRKVHSLRRKVHQGIGRLLNAITTIRNSEGILPCGHRQPSGFNLHLTSFPFGSGLNWWTVTAEIRRPSPYAALTRWVLHDFARKFVTTFARLGRSNATQSKSWLCRARSRHWT